MKSKNNQFLGIDFSQATVQEIKENFLTELFNRGYISREDYIKASKEFFTNVLKGDHSITIGSGLNKKYKNSPNN